MNNDNKKIIPEITKVKRGSQYGTVESYNPEYKASIVVRWDNGRREGWFDTDGTKGTDKSENVIFSNHE